MPKISDAQRGARREQILSAARRCFLRQGFHETSMQDLFTEAGLSSGSVYTYFSGKDDVIMAIVEENMREVMTLIHALASSESSSESLGAAIGNVVRLVEKKHDESALGPMSVLVWAETMRNAALKKRFRTAITQMRKDLTEVVRGYQDEGKLPVGAPPEAIAALIISIVPGVILQLALFGPGWVNGVDDAAEVMWSR